MDENVKKIVVIVVLAMISFSLSLGLLAEPKIQSPTSENNGLTDKLAFINLENKIVPNNIDTNVYLYNLHRELETSSETNSEQSVFQVTTDYGYTRTTGDPKKAIQDALDSLPEQRTTPCNVYLQGVFEPISYIIMKDNVNFIGKDATLISRSQLPIFIHDWDKSYSEAYGQTFIIDNEPYQDWINLHNVTFQSISFMQLVPYNHPYNSAIYFYDGNSTGWGVSDNLSVYNCQFEGFYNCIQGIAINSNYIGNYFYNYSNNAIMFPAGNMLTFEENVFDAPSNPLTVAEYQERDGCMSIQGGISLFFMDVGGDVLIVNNIFKQGINSTGITFSSSCGNFVVTSNTFLGEGDVYSADVFPRPWLSCGVKFYGNSGAVNSCYDEGIYSTNFYPT